MYNLKITNGIHQAHGFKIGDKFQYTNPNGVKFENKIVVGFDENLKIYYDSNSPWFAVEPENCKKH